MFFFEKKNQATECAWASSLPPVTDKGFCFFFAKKKSSLLPKPPRPLPFGRPQLRKLYT
jgi:hypothetical protein